MNNNFSHSRSQKYFYLVLTNLALLTITLGYIVYSNVNLTNQNRNNSAHITKFNYLYFGTSIQITVVKNNTKDLDNLSKQIENLLAKLHSKWHPWRQGELYTLNQNLASFKAFEISPEIVNLIYLSQDLYKKSHGYFNPAIGNLVNLWGFHQDSFEAHNISKNSFIINLNQIKNNLPTPNNLIVNNINKKTTLRNTNPYLKIDFSGFIKADAMLKIKDILHSYHIQNALINIGGDILALGYKLQETKNKTPWLVAVDPSHITGHDKIISEKIKNNIFSDTPIVLALTPNQTIATSGIYTRSYTNNEKLLSHIINPKTAHPVDKETDKSFSSVTVIHPDPYLADAAATALLIAGEDHYQEVAESMNIDKYILIK